MKTLNENIMNENLNLIEILKDVPIGTKLYSPIFGELSFMGINMNIEYPIKVNDEFGEYTTFDKEGKYFKKYHNTECLIFPSKENRDWSKFNIEPKFDINTLKPFDKVLSRDWNDSVWRCNIYEYYKEGQCYPFITMNGVCNQCVPYNSETKHLVGTTEMPPEKYITWE